VEVEEQKDRTDSDNMMDEDEESIYGSGPKVIVIGLAMY
jgi:hypothetical protein